MLSALSLALVACGSDSTTARCVDRNAPSGKGGYRVVPDSKCNVSDIDNGSPSSYNQYFWYYGGKRSNGYVTGGSQYRPSGGGKIKSGSGKTLSRGGFGGSGKSGS